MTKIVMIRIRFDCEFIFTVWYGTLHKHNEQLCFYIVHFDFITLEQLYVTRSKQIKGSIFVSLKNLMNLEIIYFEIPSILQFEIFDVETIR